MHWPAPRTDSTPTEPGWYWHRDISGIIRTCMREVTRSAGRLIVFDGVWWISVCDLGGEWVRALEPDEREPPPANRDDPPGFSTQPERV